MNVGTPVAFLFLVLIGAVFIAPGSSLAKDYGTHGPVWEIAEPNLLEVIQARLTAMEDSGELEDMRDEMQETTRAYVNRPRPVLGLLPAEHARTYEVDLSITLERDLMDHRGQVFARAGTRINPLDYSHYNQRIVVFDGDDPDQVAFALSEGNELDTLLVLTKGAPLELMRAHGRRFYFDQDAQFTARFQITRLPSVITRGNRVMVVEEVPVGDAR
ncbi:MAG: type-F conjugative transfer system protein TraW [Paracoccaceae bacterium]|nr:type-F conjugative transfer system protein TraW [Paracoccaceae bacterium]MDG1736560.1 type-F conjugative transfer system protein TraW [Paracoccaceae bacterium]MDG2260633.1 type-F conjugative transfer system protein TraW [Paracoccaceae bacterium]